MKHSDLKKRLRKDRPMTAVTLRMPEDVIENLKRVAPESGFSGYQPLIRHYVGQGLRADLERLDAPDLAHVLKRLKQQGVSDAVIKKALAG